MDEQLLLPKGLSWWTRYKKHAAYFLLLLVILFGLFYANFLSAPVSFPKNSLLTIQKGETLSGVATDLETAGYVRSGTVFKIITIIVGGSKSLNAGDYVITQDINAISLVWRLTHSDYQLSETKITIPEGMDVYEIGDLLSKRLGKIDKNDFARQAKTYEGYLFPDTYNFLPNITTSEVIKIMRDNFDRRLSTIEKDLSAFHQTKADIIKMASIVEEEGRTTETRRVIAGILWKRLSLNMPLQVDSSFKYINGKTTETLTLDDLKIDSPYNSYLYKGLPPTPICNPGLDSISATITPIKTAYLFFLTDKQGNMHYAKTYEEHLNNKLLYLK
ncbi:MAG: endolytic transglycosylase MltG [bacterium]